VYEKKTQQLSYHSARDIFPGYIQNEVREIVITLFIFISSAWFYFYRTWQFICVYRLLVNCVQVKDIHSNQVLIWTVMGLFATCTFCT